MNAKELRELEIWIAEHIFDAEITRTPHLVSDAYMQTESNKHLMMSPSPVPGYTTDHAAAMAVLEKCCERLSSFDVCIWKGATGPLWYCGERKNTCDITTFAKAPTLPLAICLFAKKLFKK